MDAWIIDGSIGVARGSLLRIDDGAGVLVTVWEGEVWITQEGSQRDHVLTAGQWMRLDRDGAAVAHAIRRSVIGLSAATPDVSARAVSVLKPGASPVVLHHGRHAGAWQALRRFLAGLLSPRPAAPAV